MNEPTITSRDQLRHLDAGELAHAQSGAMRPYEARQFASRQNALNRQRQAAADEAHRARLITIATDTARAKAQASRSTPRSGRPTSPVVSVAAIYRARNGHEGAR